MSVNCQSPSDWELIIASVFDQTDPVDAFLHYFLCREEQNGNSVLCITVGTLFIISIKFHNEEC